MKIDQVRKHASKILKIARKYGILKVFVFGSVARGEAGPQSDLDFLVEMRPEAPLFGVAGFGYEIEHLLGISVDVIPLSILPMIEDRDFVMAIQREAMPL